MLHGQLHVYIKKRHRFSSVLPYTKQNHQIPGIRPTRQEGAMCADLHN